MALFQKKADLISDRARVLNDEIAALESEIKRLDSQLQRAIWSKHSRIIPACAPRRFLTGRPRTASRNLPHTRPWPPPSMSRFSRTWPESVESPRRDPQHPEHYNELGVRKYDLPSPAAPDPQSLSRSLHDQSQTGQLSRGGWHPGTPSAPVRKARRAQPFCLLHSRPLSGFAGDHPRIGKAPLTRMKRNFPVSRSGRLDGGPPPRRPATPNPSRSTGGCGGRTSWAPWRTPACCAKSAC